MKNTSDGNKAQKPVAKPAKQPEEIKTDYPLSEKDEVKKAEQNTNKGINKKS